jgi:imidazolonepropionase-like amidohydrolase
VRERWFGATGRKVPEVAMEGEIDLDDALVLDDIEDTHALEEAHSAGRPVVVHASTAEDVQAALERPEVSCVLVPASARHLLKLDLTELTYG